MSEHPDEPPIVGLDRAQTQTYAQAAMALGWMLRERRQQRGRLAWSEAEAAARAHDELEDLVHDPPVRRLTPAEDRETTKTTSWADARSVTNQHEELQVRIRPTSDRRWILHAEIVPLWPGASIDERMRLRLSCDTEARARELADELAAAGPDRDLLARLAGHTNQTERRRRAARDEVAPDPELWLETVAEAAHENWSPEVAQSVTASHAFGALARHVRTLADRGYEPQAVLARIKETDLARADDAGALAAWFAKKLTQQLVVVDAEPDQPSNKPNPSDSGPMGEPDPQPTQEPMLGDIEREEIDWAAAEAVLRGAVPDVADRLVECRAWPTLARTIDEAGRAGEPVERMLASLPQDAIIGARKPAAYATHLMRQAQADQQQHSGRGSRPWPPSPRPRTAAVLDGERESLDPSSAVDRVLLDSARPAGGPVDPAAAASHHDATEDAEAAADLAERAAGYERAHPDVPGAAAEADADERIDENLAAGYRAAAADERSAAAAALRAEVPLTPADGSAPARQPAGPTYARHPRPVPVRTPTHHPRRTR